MPTALRAENITVRFGGVTAVNDISLAVREGEILGLIGPNGAGKTTLFNAVTGFVPIDRGRILLFDRDITALPPHRRTREGFGRTFQTERPFEELTVLENVLAGAGKPSALRGTCSARWASPIAPISPRST